MTIFIANKKRMEMYLEFDNFIPHEKVSLIRDMVVKRGNRIPLQHLLGSVEFCDLIDVCLCPFLFCPSLCLLSLSLSVSFVVSCVCIVFTSVSVSVSVSY